MGWGEIVNAALGSLGAIAAIIGTAIMLWVLWVIAMLIAESLDYRRARKLSDETRCNRPDGDCFPVFPDDLKSTHSREF